MTSVSMQYTLKDFFGKLNLVHSTLFYEQVDTKFGGLKNSLDQFGVSHEADKSLK